MMNYLKTNIFTNIPFSSTPCVQVSDVIRPTADWGPGDKQARKMYQANKAARQKGKL